MWIILARVLNGNEGKSEKQPEKVFSKEPELLRFVFLNE